jgi:hypothetical protein
MVGRTEKPTNLVSRQFQFAKLLRIAMLLSLGACSSLSPAPAPSSPFFQADSEEAKYYRTAAHTQDLELARCSAWSECDQAYFTRALIALFESREAATRYFQNVIAMSPKSHLAGSSRSWLQLLHESPVSTMPESLMVVTTKRLVRDMLERDFAARRELTVRDRKLEELSVQLKKAEELGNQLEALKRIEQEIKERSRPIKPSTKISGEPTPPSERHPGAH